MRYLSVRIGGSETMKQFTVRTNAKAEMIDITDRIRILLKESRIKSGVCHVFVPHTTAAVTINENADPDVPRDILMELGKIVPLNDHYRHVEGNSAAHIKASILGASETVFIEDGELVLGTWQSIFFCEFDGPRSRRVIVMLTALEAPEIASAGRSHGHKSDHFRIGDMCSFTDAKLILFRSSLMALGFFQAIIFQTWPGVP